jgi:hypothetical protein
MAKEGDVQQQINLLLQQADWCDRCKRQVAEGTEHDFEAHLSTKERAEELAKWKKSFGESGDNDNDCV